MHQTRVACPAFLPPLPGEGWGGGTAAERSNGPNTSRAKRWRVTCPLPSGCAEERSVSRIRARPCLSEASSARPRETRAPQVARSEAKGRRQRGRLFFGYFLLAKQKKVARPPGRDPAPERKPTQPSSRQRSQQLPAAHTSAPTQHKPSTASDETTSKAKRWPPQRAKETAPSP